MRQKKSDLGGEIGGRKFGYARVSTLGQNLNAQTDALINAGCERIYTDKMSGAVDARPGLTTVMSELKRGDTLVVSHVDRLGRNTRHLLALLDELKAQGIAFQSLTESFDTATASGELNIAMLAAFSQYERSTHRERIIAGLVAARSRGRIGGRPKALPEAKPEGVTVRAWCKQLGIAPSTYYRNLRYAEDHATDTAQKPHGV